MHSTFFVQCVACLTLAVPVQDSFWDRIQKVRNQELHILWKSAIVSSMYAFLLNTIPVIVSVVTFTAYVLLGNNLTAAKAFTSLSLFTVSLQASLQASDQGKILYNI